MSPSWLCRAPYIDGAPPADLRDTHWCAQSVRAGSSAVGGASGKSKCDRIVRLRRTGSGSSDPFDAGVPRSASGIFRSTIQEIQEASGGCSARRPSSLPAGRRDRRLCSSNSGGCSLRLPAVTASCWEVSTGCELARVGGTVRCLAGTWRRAGEATSAAWCWAISPRKAPPSG